MTPKSKPSRVHHFVPRSALRRFAADADRSFVMVFDKQTGRAYQGGMTPTGSGKDYNVLRRPDGSVLHFENDFDQIDADYALVGDELARRRSLAGLDDAFLHRLADVAAVQLLRTPLIRSTLEKLPRDFFEDLAAHGFEAPTEDELPDDNAVRQSTRETIAKRDRQRMALLAKDIVLFEPTGAGRFWISDHPVVTHSLAPLGQTGLESLGVEIYLPIASDLLVGFLCPSLRDTQVIHHDAAGEHKVRMERFVTSGAPLGLTDARVNFFNSLQVMFSQRFLYASRDAFDLARKMIARWPELASNDTLIHVGKMGQAPPRSRNIPPGDWLYLETNHDYLMIPIRDYDGEGFTRQMSTDRLDLLAEALDRGEFLEAQVFTEQYGSMTRGVKLERVEGADPGRFRICCIDPFMRSLDEQHALKKGDG